MSFFAAAGFTVFILILFTGIFLNLFGLPGTIVIFFDVLFYSILTGFDRIGWEIILFLLVCAAAAEAIDFFLSIDATPQPAASKKIIGTAVLGALLGTFLLTPFWGGPGVWIGFFLGGLAGILTTEAIRQSKLKAPYRAIHRAIFAMAGKKIIKGFIALCMIAFSLSNIYS